MRQLKTTVSDPRHLKAVAQALLVTFLWSTSWVLIKLGLEDIPALTFAGLRYTLAFLFLLPLAFRRRSEIDLAHVPRKAWLQIAALGLLFYAVTQGAQFFGLAYLPAITVNLLLSFTIIIVVLLGIFFLNEMPTAGQWIGMVIFLVGVAIFFYPPEFPGERATGLIVVIIGVIANAVSSILGRDINRRETLPPIIITIVSMAIGGLVLLAAGLIFQGLPSLNLSSWGIVLWLAVVNSAFAFTLWNHTLRTLSAMESTLINNTMMIQIPILAWLFLGENPSPLEIIGMILAGFGIVVVQMRWRKDGENSE
ncbi:MAG: DMT family transporter [Candidatus Promineifilaceae bacterium]|jgi:drug/metabolite transporter (DMT)-like permease